MAAVVVMEHRLLPAAVKRLLFGIGDGEGAPSRAALHSFPRRLTQPPSPQGSLLFPGTSAHDALIAAPGLTGRSTVWLRLWLWHQLHS